MTKYSNKNSKHVKWEEVLNLRKIRAQFRRQLLKGPVVNAIKQIEVGCPLPHPLLRGRLAIIFYLQAAAWMDNFVEELQNLLNPIDRPAGSDKEGGARRGVQKTARGFYFQS